MHGGLIHQRFNDVERARWTLECVDVVGVRHAVGGPRQYVRRPRASASVAWPVRHSGVETGNAASGQWRTPAGRSNPHPHCRCGGIHRGGASPYIRRRHSTFRRACRMTEFLGGRGYEKFLLGFPAGEAEGLRNVHVLFREVGTPRAPYPELDALDAAKQATDAEEERDEDEEVAHPSTLRRPGLRRQQPGRIRQARPDVLERA
jgi:hypothetical protein